jgi:kynurenine 3-monooxygenase
VDALPTREGLHVGVLLFRPTDHRVLSIATAKDARAFFAEHLPQLLPWIDDAALESFARKTVSRLPQFQYCGPVLHRGGEAALLGDAIHTVKPFFGFGVNQANPTLIVAECTPVPLSETLWFRR